MNKPLFLTALFGACFSACAASPAGLLARYPFDRPYGLYEEDVSGQSPRLKVTRDDWEYRELSTREPGFLGNAIRIAPRAAVTGSFPAGRVFTLMFRLKPERGNTRDTVSIKDFFNSSIDSSNRFILTAAGKKLSAPLKIGAWNAASITSDGKNLTLYMNGDSAGSIPMPSGSPEGKAFSMSRLGDSASYFRGLFDEIRIYNHPLAEQDLKEMAGDAFYRNESFPSASAGIARTVWLPAKTVSLKGSVERAERMEWRIVKSPTGSRASIAEPGRAQTSLRMDLPGDYELELTAYGRDGIARSRTRAVLFDPQPVKIVKPFVGKIKAGTIIPRNDMAGKNPPSDFSADYLRKHFPEPVIPLQKQGFAAERFSPPPPPYAHPRVFFNPEELDSIRTRLRDTRSGQANYEYVTAQLDNRFRGFKPDEPYPLMVSSDPKNIPARGYEFASALVNESFRALIEADSSAARRLIDQMMRQAVEQQNMMNQPKLLRSDDWRNHFHHVMGRNATPLMYDFLYPWMTAKERAAIRAVIARATQDKWVLGMNAPVAQARSNWLCWCAGDMLQAVTAIEWEDGYPAEVAKELERTFRHWITVGIFPGSGAAYEGMGKNALTSQNLAILSRRGEPLIASKAAYHHYTGFLLGCLQPFGGVFCADDLWGGSRKPLNYQDAVAMKYAYPDDPAIDFVYRNAAGEDYRLWKLGGTTYRYCIDVLPLIFGTDIGPAADPGKPLDYFASEINLATARSSWAKDAAFLYFLPRMHGGHNSPARGTFVFSALGRDWTIYPTGHNDKDALQHSVVTYDGKNQFALEDSVMLAFESAPESMFAACDLRYVHTGSAPQTMTNNDFRLVKLAAPWENIPRGMIPHWYVGSRPTIGKPDPQQNWNSRVRYAFRSAGLVRGKHSYALISDDFDVDGRSHLYRWQMILAPEVVKDAAINGNQVILTDPATGARLLVLALAPAEVKWRISPSPDEKKYGKFHSLGFQTDSVKFAARVLLLPLAKGEALPQIVDNSIRFADGTSDRLEFRTASDGRTRITLFRDGKNIAKLQ